MKLPEGRNSRRISVDLPEHLIERFDELKREWGLRGRGAVLKRLLEVILPEDETSENDFTTNEDSVDNKAINETNYSIDPSSKYDEDAALVLISDGSLATINDQRTSNQKNEPHIIKTGVGQSSPGGIDLPGFVRNKSDKLRKSLKTATYLKNTDEIEDFIPTVKEKDITLSLNSASKHWHSLYGQHPGETVIEAAMIWIATDIWPQLEDTEEFPFTWTAANRKMKRHYPHWQVGSASLEKILVIAGVLEDPFATSSLPERMPTLIRRFVNRFKRSRNVTSFQTIESTMTVSGALKLLELPTQPGAQLTLSKIRGAYKNKAMQCHPDSGGTTESMRRLNEAYQMLKELYRQK